MKSVTAKYPIKIGKILVPKGTVGTIADIEEIRPHFPNIKCVEGSSQISVKFLDLEPCIVHISQLIIQ